MCIHTYARVPPRPNDVPPRDALYPTSRQMGGNGWATPPPPTRAENLRPPPMIMISGA